MAYLACLGRHFLKIPELFFSFADTIKSAAMAETNFSKKHEEFVRSGMKDAKTADYKDITTVAGVGEKGAAELKKIGFTKAFHLLVRSVSFF